MVANSIKIIKYLTFFPDIMCFFFSLMNANKARLLSVVKQIKKRPIFASDMLTIV